ncbi:hypothetical protein HID58_070648 [Brassica napus]|uniref:Secreted protein n=1 Tax=Brassica napus TaxID=3708 RepID=A0ABQ7YZB3_BRANA|nr:hypothetical protein HID58_070648 [Brassica napus]
MFPFSVLCFLASPRCRSGVWVLDLRRSKVKEWMCGFFGQAERWVSWLAWLKALRVSQTVELQCFFRFSRWSHARCLLGRSTFLSGASHELLSSPSWLGLLQVLCSGDMCEVTNCWSCQPRQISLVAARVESARIGG